MDRTLKIYTKTEHLFAEFDFHYDHANQAKARYTMYRRLYNDDEEDDNKSVYPAYEADLYAQFRQFSSIDEIKAHDVDFVKKELRGDMNDPRGYTFVYDSSPVLLRYVAENHQGCIGMVEIRFSFIDNTKEVKFLSATHPRFDVDISSNSLESNIDCILRIPVYTDRDIRQLYSYDLKKLGAWY